MYCGIDIGGTKIEICRFDRNFTVVHQELVPTSELLPGDITFAERLETLLASRSIPADDAIGVACKGLVHQGELTYCSLMGGPVSYPLQERLQARLERPTSVMNDVHALAYAERRFGEAQQSDHFVVVNLGTGLGVVAWDTALVQGVSSCAGEISTLRRYVPELAREERYETLVSGAGLRALASTFGFHGDAASVFQSKDTDVNAKMIQHLFCDSLAELLELLSYCFNPERLILSGSVAKSAALFLADVEQRYRTRTDPYSHATLVVSHIPHAASLGAALFAAQAEHTH